MLSRLGRRAPHERNGDIRIGLSDDARSAAGYPNRREARCEPAYVLSVDFESFERQREFL